MISGQPVPQTPLPGRTADPSRTRPSDRPIPAEFRISSRAKAQQIRLPEEQARAPPRQKRAGPPTALGPETGDQTPARNGVNHQPMAGVRLRRSADSSASGHPESLRPRIKRPWRLNHPPGPLVHIFRASFQKLPVAAKTKQSPQIRPWFFSVYSTAC